MDSNWKAKSRKIRLVRYLARPLASSPLEKKCKYVDIRTLRKSKILLKPEKFRKHRGLIFNSTRKRSFTTLKPPRPHLKLNHERQQKGRRFRKGKVGKKRRKKMRLIEENRNKTEHSGGEKKWNVENLKAFLRNS